MMIRTKLRPFRLLTTFLTISILMHSGCDSAAQKEAASKQDKTESSATENVDSNGQSDESATASNNTPVAKPAQQTDDDSVQITGSLDSIDWESLIGQKVTIQGDLVIVDTYDLVRRGQVKIARDRLYIPTSQIDPNDADPNGNTFEGGSNVAKVTSAQKFNDNGTVILDDGPADENIFPPTLFPNLGQSNPTVRAGSVIHGVSGKLVRAGRKILLVPDGPLNWTPAERPARPDVGDADVVVASFNVLNYFTTIDDGSNNARGADSESELQRQEAKIVAAILALKADVVGLMEIENNTEAELRLVAALNKAIGEDVFDGCGIPDGFRTAPGGQDAIRVGIIYRKDRVEAVDAASIIRDDAFRDARTPIVQRFKPTGGDRSFAVIVNHFKSKGSADRASEADKNKGDGQGAYNATRRAQSLAICNYIDTQQKDDAEARVLVIGDLNAYNQEDPIDALRARGLVDLQEMFADQQSNPPGRLHYSYLYYGQSGSLDHAFATKAMTDSVTGIATWHINADEPRSLDFNQEYNPESLYQADPFRSSDHDPVLIGIRN